VSEKLRLQSFQLGQVSIFVKITIDLQIYRADLQPVRQVGFLPRPHANQIVQPQPLELLVLVLSFGGTLGTLQHFLLLLIRHPEGGKAKIRPPRQIKILVNKNAITPKNMTPPCDFVVN
jgi:hypothetical protein